MIRNNEVEIRTENNMLLCTAITNQDGDYTLISRRGKKEDCISLNSLLSQLYGREVAIKLL